MGVAEDLMQELIEAIQRAEKSGLTRAELSRRTGIPESSLSRFVNRKRRGLNLSSIEKLCDELGIRLTIAKKGK